MREGECEIKKLKATDTERGKHPRKKKHTKQ